MIPDSLPLFSEMSPEQAREVFDLFVHEEVPRWRGWLLERSGLLSKSALDGTDDDLVRLWNGVLDEWRRVGLSIEVVDPGDEPEPLLARIGGGGWPAGSRFVRLASGVGAFVGDWLVTTHGGNWVLTPSTPGVAEGNEVCVDVPGGGGILPFTFATVCLNQLSKGIARRDRPESLRDAVRSYLPSSQEKATDDLEWSLEQIEAGRWSVMFNDLVAYDQEERIESFVAALAGRSGFRRVLHEDRELVLCETALDEKTVRAAISEAWSETSDR